jgi:hypothetical protein
LRGFELLGLQIGTDFELDTSIKLGPFISYSIGQFGYGTKTQKDALTDASRSLGIANMAMHQWLFLGLRGVFNI